MLEHNCNPNYVGGVSKRIEIGDQCQGNSARPQANKEQKNWSRFSSSVSILASTRPSVQFQYHQGKNNLETTIIFIYKISNII
jgi:hypothetical protein